MLSNFVVICNKDVLGLLAYTNPQTSPVAHLASERQREVVADELNAVILGKHLHAHIHARRHLTHYFLLILYQTHHKRESLASLSYCGHTFGCAQAHCY